MMCASQIHDSANFLFSPFESGNDNAYSFLLSIAICLDTLHVRAGVFPPSLYAQAVK